MAERADQSNLTNDDRLILTDDFYVDRNPNPNACNPDDDINDCNWHAVNERISVPDIAVGRLIETPDQIINTIKTFLKSNLLNLDNVAVAGHAFNSSNPPIEFLMDSSQEQCNSWQNDNRHLS